MNLKILTPEKLALEQDVESVTVPGTCGQFTVLAGHDITLASVKGGLLYFRYNDNEGKSHRKDFTVSAGITAVTKDSVKIFVGKVEMSSSNVS